MSILPSAPAPFSLKNLLWRPVKGAVGNGIVDDSDAIIASIAKLQNVYLPPGKTYLISKPLSLSSGQSLFMGNATLILANQISDTTATNITVGPTSTAITVTNGAQWKVGQTITVVNGSSYDAAPHRINSIVGNVLTVGTAFTTPFTSGGTVYQTMVTVTLNGNASIIEGTIDGNRANWAWGHWEVSQGIQLQGTGNLVQQTVVQNYFGEGSVAFGTNHRYQNAYFTNLDGNGIHLSGTTHVTADGCFGLTLNLNPSVVGHGNGFLILSNTCSQTTFTNCYGDTALTGVGSLDSFANSSGVVNGCFFYNMTTAGIDAPSSGVTDVASRWRFVNNEIGACPYGIRVANISSVLTITGATNASPIVLTFAGTAVFTVSGVTITPGAGSTWTSGGVTYTYNAVNITGGAGTFTATGNSAPAASGTLTKASGTGDATMTFSASSWSTASTLVDGQNIQVYGVGGNTNANGQYFAKVTGLSTGTCSLYFDSGLTLPVAGNSGYTSGGSAFSAVSNYTISGNTIYNSTTQSIYISKARNIAFGGGNVISSIRGSGGIPSVLIDDSINVQGDIGTISGGTYGLYLQSTVGVAKDVHVEAICTSQYSGGVYCQSSLSGCSNITVKNATVYAPNDAQTNTSVYIGIQGAPGVIVRGCDVTLDFTTVGSRALLCSGNSNIFMNCRTIGGEYSVAAAGGTSGNYVSNNAVNQVTHDAGSAGANQFVGNYDPANVNITSAALTTRDGSNTVAIVQPVSPSSTVALQLSPKGGGTVHLGGHLTGASTNTVTLGAAAGTGPTNNSISNDTFTGIKFTTGTGATSGTICTFPVASSYSGSPFYIVYGQDTASQAIPITAVLSAGTWTISTTAVLASTTTYSFAFYTYLPGNATG